MSGLAIESSYADDLFTYARHWNSDKKIQNYGNQQCKYKSNNTIRIDKIKIVVIEKERNKIKMNIQYNEIKYRKNLQFL